MQRYGWAYVKGNAIQDVAHFVTDAFGYGKDHMLFAVARRFEIGGVQKKHAFVKWVFRGDGFMTEVDTLRTG